MLLKSDFQINVDFNGSEKLVYKEAYIPFLIHCRKNTERLDLC